MKSSVFGRTAPVAAFACAVLFAGLYGLAVGTARGRRLDGANGINAPAHEPYRTAVQWLAELGTVSGGVALVATSGALLLALAWLRLGPRAVVAVVVLLAGAVGSARALKAILGNLDLVGGERLRSFGPGYYPSGHASALMALALAVALITPPGARRTILVLACGAAVAVASVGYVLAPAHYPSDMIGGFLLASVWALLVAGWLNGGSAAIDARSARAAIAAAAAVAVVAAVVAATIEVKRAALAGDIAVAAAAFAICGCVAALIAPLPAPPKWSESGLPSGVD